MADLRAKFVCNRIVTYPETDSVKAELSAVKEGSEENRSFWDATTAGEMKIWVSNPTARGYFEVGKEYFLDFTAADQESENPKE